MAHKQTTVKVNAKVDCGIAPLVKSLSLFPELTTISSCEGDDATGAYVAFTVRDDSWREIGEFTERLSALLGQDRVACDLPFTLAVEWYAGGSGALGYLRTPHQHIEALSRAVQSIATERLGAPAVGLCSLVARDAESLAV